MNRLDYSEIVGNTLHLSFADGGEVALPLPDRYYPVLVTDTREHVIYFEADNADGALSIAKDYPDIHEEINGETCVDADITAALPTDKWDWRAITRDSSFGYPGTPYNEHVENHKRVLWQQEHEAKKAACAERAHLGNERTWRNGRVECDLCHVTLVEAPPVVQPEAASPLSDRPDGAA